MNYKVFIYAISIVASTFAISSLNLNRFFKQGKVFEANLFAILLIIALSELVSAFVINFLEVSKIL